MARKAIRMVSTMYAGIQRPTGRTKILARCIRTRNRSLITSHNQTIDSRSRTAHSPCTIETRWDDKVVAAKGYRDEWEHPGTAFPKLSGHRGRKPRSGDSNIFTIMPKHSKDTGGDSRYDAWLLAFYVQSRWNTKIEFTNWRTLPAS